MYGWGIGDTSLPAPISNTPTVAPSDSTQPSFVYLMYGGAAIGALLFLYGISSGKSGMTVGGLALAGVSLSPVFLAIKGIT